MFPEALQRLHEEDSLTLRETAAHIAGILAHRHGADDAARVFENISGGLLVLETAKRLSA